MSQANIQYVVSLAKRETNTIGFIPAPRYELLAQQRRLRVQLYNGEPCGFLAHGPLRPGRVLYIYQACIQSDARRLACATSLVCDLIRDANAAYCAEIQLNCAADLPSNLFWQTLGFIRHATSSPANTRRRQVNHYVLPLARRFLLF